MVLREVQEKLSSLPHPQLEEPRELGQRFGAAVLLQAFATPTAEMAGICRNHINHMNHMSHMNHMTMSSPCITMSQLFKKTPHPSPQLLPTNLPTDPAVPPLPSAVWLSGAAHAV